MAVAAPPAPATVLRLPVGDADWTRVLPRVPTGVSLTISAPTPEVAETIAEGIADLRAGGYLFIGHIPVGLSSPVRVVDLVVPGYLIEDEPAWWAELSGLAVAVLPLLFGPVQRRLAGLAAAHRALRPHRQI